MKKLSPGISTRGTETGSIEGADKQLTENSTERTAAAGREFCLQSALAALLAPQSAHRIRQRGLQCLVADSRQRGNDRQNSRDDEDSPRDSYTVIITLEPLIGRIISQRQAQHN